MTAINKEQVKQIAIDMVKSDGLINLSRSGLCEAAGIPNGSFPHVMGCTFSKFVEELKEFDQGSTAEVNKTRTDPELRKGQILNVAIELSKELGYHKVTRDGIAERAGISAGLISRYFNTMTQLKRAIIRAAIHQEIPEIVAQGLANQDDHARKAPPELKRKALELMANY